MGEGLPTFTQFFNLMRSSSGDGDPVFVLLTLELVTWNVWAEALCGRPSLEQEARVPQAGSPPPPALALPGRAEPSWAPPATVGVQGHTRMCWHSPQASAVSKARPLH